MSRVRATFLTSLVTVWKQQPRQDDDDPYSDGEWSTPVTYKCNYRNGGSVTRDNEGGEFYPLTTYRLQTSGSIPIAIGDRVALGGSVEASPVDEAETVRQIVSKTPLVGALDYNVITG